MLFTARPQSSLSGKVRLPFARGREQGFTLIETLVSLTISVGVMVGILTLFDQNNQLARSQTYIAEMQNSLRVGQDEITRNIRMGGRGGLPRGPLPSGLALSVRNNTPVSGDARYIAVGDADTPLVLPGTDVLTVRGALSGSVYQVNPLGGGFVVDDPSAPTAGTIRVDNPHSTTGVPQDLQPLIDALENDPHPAILLVSPVDNWVVVEGDKTTSVTDQDGYVIIGFKVGTLGGPYPADKYVQLSGGFPATLRNVANVALLEEYRYYVREERAISGDDQSEVVPRLVKARFYPNTELGYYTDPDFGSEVSDNVLDLQFALGIDADGDGSVVEGVDGVGALPPGAVSKDQDEWLFNTAGDVDSDGNPVEMTKWNPALGFPELAYVRVTTIARTDRPDRSYLAPLLVRNEDKDFSQSPFNVYNLVGERRYRRRQMQTVVDMRNL